MKSILILFCVLVLFGSVWAEIEIMGVRTYGWYDTDEYFDSINIGTTGELLLSGVRDSNDFIVWMQTRGTVTDYLSIGLAQAVPLPDGGFIAQSGFDTDFIYRIAGDHSVAWQYSMQLSGAHYIYVTSTNNNTFLVPYTTSSGDDRYGKLDELSDSGQLVYSVEMQLVRPHFLRQAFQLPDGTYLAQGFESGMGFTCQVGENGEILWINYLDGTFNVAWNAPTHLLPDGTFLGRISNPDLVPGLEDLVWFDKDGEILRTVGFTGGFDPPKIEAVLPDGGILMNNGERLDAAGNLLYDMDYWQFLDAIEDSLGGDYSGLYDVEPTDNFRYYAVGYVSLPDNNWPGEYQNDAWLAAAGPGPEPIRLSARKRAPEGPVDPASPMRLRARVYNRGDVTQTVDIWTVARTPDWEVVGPIRMWSDVNIEPGEELAATLTQWVPEFAPAGDYNYILRVGDYPEHHYEAYFPFEVTENQRADEPRWPNQHGQEQGSGDTRVARFLPGPPDSTADRSPQSSAPIGWEMLIELIERYPTTDDQWFATD